MSTIQYSPKAQARRERAALAARCTVAPAADRASGLLWSFVLGFSGTFALALVVLL